MPVTKEKILSELDFLSDKLSDRSRTISAGVIAIWWALLVSDKTHPATLSPKNLIGPVICALIALSLDFLQYAVGYAHHYLALRYVEREKVKEFSFNRRDALYRARNYIFWAKQLAAFISIGWTIVVVARVLVP